MSTKFRIMVFLIVAIATIPSPIKAINHPSRKLDETTNPAADSPNGEVKCGSCPCGTTCYSSPPPPPPPTPSPPPPSPPPPKKPSSPKCPPPPYGGGGGGGGSGGGGGGGSGQAPPNYIYASGPPGDLYPVVQSISAAYKRFAVAPAGMVVFGLMGMLAFW